jgi:hypothetical protein
LHHTPPASACTPHAAPCITLLLAPSGRGPAPLDGWSAHREGSR